MNWFWTIGKWQTIKSWYNIAFSLPDGSSNKLFQRFEEVVNILKMWFKPKKKFITTRTICE